MYREYISDYQYELCQNIYIAFSNLNYVERLKESIEKVETNKPDEKALLLSLVHNMHLDMQEQLYSALDDIVTA